MADITKAFNVEEGLSLKDEVIILSGSNDPSVVGEAAPIGSMYLRTNGSLWSKTGAGDNQWYNNSVGSVTQHNLLSGLGADDHTQYVHNTIARTITVQHTFNPGSVQAPFVLGANASGQVVTGLNADLLDGQHGSYYQTGSTQLNTVSAIAATGIMVRVSSASWVGRTITGTAGQISVTNGSGTAGNPTLSLTASGVTAGTYNNLTVDATGRATAGSNIAYLTANQTITLTGDITGSGSTSITTTLSNTGVVAGTYNKVTVDAKGRVTGSGSLASTDITNALGFTPIAWSDVGTPSGIASLGPDSKLLASQLPDLAISDTFVVASQSAMLALVAQKGDVAVRTDISKSFILKGSDPTVLADWQELLTPTASNLVTSVNGQTGAVTISTITGNAGTATTLQTARTISLTSDVTGSASFDGSANASITATLSNTGVVAGTYTKVTVDAKGRVTSGAQALLDNLSDVTITSPANGQILSFSGTEWINSNLTNGATSALLSSWTLVSGNRYSSNFSHNLGSFNLVVTLYDTANNSIVFADSIQLIDANTIKVTVIGNTRTLRVVVVANGVSIAAGGSNPASIIVKDEGVNVINTPHTSLNFTGNVTVSDAGSGIATVNIPGSAVLRTLSFPATSFDSPNNADWSINALAPVVVDPANQAIPTRRFSNTVEQGVGLMISIPSGATNLVMKLKSKSETAQASATIVQPRLYSRLIPNNATMGSWSSAYEMANIAIPNNAFYQYSQQTISLSSLGMVAGNLYQIELTRRISGLTGGTNLPANWLIVELTIEFL